MSIEKYLSNYSEPETGFATLVTSTYQYVLCIPAYAEPTAFVERLKLILEPEPVLVILVINSPDENADPLLLNQTNELLEYCQTQSVIRRTDGASLHELSTGPQRDMLVIDRCSEHKQIPHKQGVGLARKIAADIALTLISVSKVTSQWIFFSDADVSFPSGYFAAANDISPETTSTLIYPFRHTEHKDLAIRHSQNLYDFTLYYYEQGLRYAHSPYAWQTLGSTLAVSARHYALVRGVPKRNAGEDFHLINKLSKTGSVIQLDSPVLEIESRLSTRVPYGTGPALNRLIATDNPADALSVYSPTTFNMLKLALKGLYASYPLVRNRKLVETDELFCEWCSQANTERIVAVLDMLGTADAINSAAVNSTEEKSYLRHITHWFDALKTLRFIHLMRDTYYPSQPIIEVKQDPLYQSTLDLMKSRAPEFRIQ